MALYDLCIAWNWEHDADFAVLLAEACGAQNVSLLQVTPANLAETLLALAGDRVAFRAFFDRASDADEAFLPLAEWASRRAPLRINARERAARAWDKAAMHQVLSVYLLTPVTLILPPHDEQPDLPPLNLSALGGRFTIKPAHGGGGEGVVMEAMTLEQVLAARRERPSDRYLLQAHIAPAQIGERPAWFRVLFCAGRAYPCWWDPRSHTYALVTMEEESAHGLSALRETVTAIAQVCGLDLFSTEVALEPGRRFVVVDYVNDPVDLRLQARTPEGVPDAIVRNIAERLADLVKGNRDGIRE